MFNCRTCTPKQKKARGCQGPFKRKVIWKIDGCPFCGGVNENCLYCKGRRFIPVRQCPRAVARGEALLPYFLAYWHSNSLAWPDGRGRLYQPTALVVAFDIFSDRFVKYEKQEADKMRDRAKNAK